MIDVAHALLRAVFALLRTLVCEVDPGVHTSVNAARRSACATSIRHLSDGLNHQLWFIEMDPMAALSGDDVLAME